MAAELQPVVCARAPSPAFVQLIANLDSDQLYLNEMLASIERQSSGKRQFSTVVSETGRKLPKLKRRVNIAAIAV